MHNLIDEMLDRRFHILLKYFKDGTAESDKDILKDVFVETQFFARILDIPNGCPMLLVGKKGSGKSAVLRYLDEGFDRNNIPSLLLNPEDIDIDWGNDNSSGQLIRRAKRCLVLAIASKIGKSLDKKLLSADQAVLNDIAKIYTEKGDDVVEKTCKSLNAISKIVKDIDFKSLFERPEADSLATPKIISSIKSSLERSEKVFYLFIDNTDRLATPNLEGLNRIWAFILALRSIMSDMPFLRVIISLRTEIWYRLENDNTGQRDQIDHFRPHKVEIKVSTNDIELILKKRFNHACNELKEKDYLISFFNNVDHIEINETTRRWWLEYVAHRSRNRPRDAIQIVNQWGRYCIDKNSYINSDGVNFCMIKHSEDSVDDLTKEYKDECPKLRNVIEDFAKFESSIGSFTFIAEDLKRMLLSSLNGITLNNASLSPSRNGEILLWKFLYEIGFLSARYGQNKSETYGHIMFQDEPHLLETTEWNKFQKYSWEVYPAYIDFLQKKRNENTIRNGIGIKKKSSMF